MDDELAVAGARGTLGAELGGRMVAWFTEIPSTNAEARRLADQGAREGTVVIADYQTAGRGRLGRRWEAPPGSSLLLSLVFRPELAVQQVQQLTMLCGLAVADGLEMASGLTADLKWPNDIVVDHAKLGGILTETVLRGPVVEYCVVGIGLNVNLDPAELPPGLLMPAASLCRTLGRKVSRLSLLRALLVQIDARYGRLRAGWSPAQDWQARLSTLGRRVRVSTLGTVREGTAVGVDENGGLLLQLDDGRQEAIIAGDVALRESEDPWED